MPDFVSGVETVFLVVAIDKYTKKWQILNAFYSEAYALKYLEWVPKVYPEYNHFFVYGYVKSGIVAEIKPH